jgi:hypothetical protein
LGRLHHGSPPLISEVEVRHDPDDIAYDLLTFTYDDGRRVTVRIGMNEKTSWYERIKPALENQDHEAIEMFIMEHML